MAAVDYYELLGIDPSADPDQIRVAIRKTRGRYRQQAGSPNLEQRSNAERMIALIGEAEKALTDPTARQGYDAARSAEPEQPSKPEPRSKPEPTGPTAGNDGGEWIETARAYLADGALRNASAAAMEATRVAPDNIEGWLVRSAVALASQDFRDAEFAATEANRRAPSEPKVVGNLAEVYLAEDRYAEAEKTFERVSILEPGEPYWRIRAAWAAIEQGRNEDALHTARELAAEHPNKQDVRDGLALLLLRDGEDAMTVTQDGGTYLTAKHQIDHIESRVAEVESLGPLSNRVTRFLDQAKANAAAAKKRRFLMPSGKAVGWLLLWLLLGAWVIWFVLSGVLGDTLGLFTGLAANAGIGYVFFTHVFPHQWKLNARVVGPYAPAGR